MCFHLIYSWSKVYILISTTLINSDPMGWKFECAWSKIIPSQFIVNPYHTIKNNKMKTGLLHMTCPIRVKTDPILQILLPVWKMDVLYIPYALNKTIAECLENELVNITFPEITK